MRNPGALGSLTLRQTSTTNGHGLAGSVPGRYQNGQGPAKAPSFVNWSCTDFDILIGTDEGMCRSFAGPETMDFCHVFESSDSNLFELKWTHAHDRHDLPGTNDGRRMSWSHESRIPVGEPSGR